MAPPFSYRATSAGTRPPGSAPSRHRRAAAASIASAASGASVAPATHAASSDAGRRDAARVGGASGVRLESDAARLPVSHRCASWREAVSEGEDHELLISCAPRHPEIDDPPFTAEPPLIGPVGRVRACREGEAPGATIIDPPGAGHDASAIGWDHGA